MIPLSATAIPHRMWELCYDSMELDKAIAPLQFPDMYHKDFWAKLVMHALPYSRAVPQGIDIATLLVNYISVACSPCFFFFSESSLSWPHTATSSAKMPGFKPRGISHLDDTRTSYDQPIVESSLHCGSLPRMPFERRDWGSTPVNCVASWGRHDVYSNGTHSEDTRKNKLLLYWLDWPTWRTLQPRSLVRIASWHTLINNRR